jgi:hypothetical protein
MGQDSQRTGESHEGDLDFRGVVAVAPAIAADSMDLAWREPERYAGSETSHLDRRIAVQTDGQSVAVDPFEQAHRLKKLEAIRFAEKDAY